MPAEAVGKKIKCKACQHVFAVPGDGPPKPAVAKPATAKPATTKPASPPPPPPPVAAAPIPFKDDDDEDDDTPGAKPKAYGVTKDEDEDVARCPFCAVELDPPDTKICLNCGYDMTVRRRHRTVKTYSLTSGDYFMWWLPPAIWGTVLLLCGGCIGYSFFTLEGQVRSDDNLKFMLKEEENPLTKQKEFMVHPMACNVCCALVWVGMAGWGVPVIVKRIKQPKPTEEEKKK